MSTIRYHAQEILRLLDAEGEPEPPVENTDVWTIEQHPNSKSLDGNTYPAGTTINFLFMVFKNGKGAVADVIVSLPNGDIEIRSNPNGSLGISQVRVPEGGMTLKATLKDFPDQSASYRINATGTAPKPKDPEPEQPTGGRPKPTQKQYTPFLQSGQYEVLVNFGDKDFEWIQEPVDVRINGKWYEFWGRSQSDPIWNQRLHNTRGLVFYLNEPVRSVELDLSQIHREGSENYGYGYFNWKVTSAPSDMDMRNATGNPSKDYIFGVHKDFGIQLYRHGSNGRNFDNPEFWRYSVPQAWNETGKIKILISRWEGQ